MRIDDLGGNLNKKIINEAENALRIVGGLDYNPEPSPSSKTPPKDNRRQRGTGGRKPATRPTDTRTGGNWRKSLTDLNPEQKKMLQKEISKNPSFWKKLSAWGAKTAGRHAGATVASGVAGPAAPYAAIAANIALLGYDVYSLARDLTNVPEELPKANPDDFSGSIPIEAPPRPSRDNTKLAGRNLKGAQGAWDRQYKDTHNLDGSPVQNFDPSSDIPVFQPEPVSPPSPTETPLEIPQPSRDAPISRPPETPRLPPAAPTPSVPTVDPRTAPAPSVSPVSPTQPVAPKPTPSPVRPRPKTTTSPKTVIPPNLATDTAETPPRVPTEVQPRTTTRTKRDDGSPTTKSRRTKPTGSDYDSNFEPTKWSAIELYDPLDLKRSEKYLNR